MDSWLEKILKPFSGERAGSGREYWLDDAKCKACYECETPFSVFVRRHHCRICGRLFCGNCSKNYIPPPRDSAEPDWLRVCNYCHRVRQWPGSSDGRPPQADGLPAGLSLPHAGLGIPARDLTRRPQPAPHWDQDSSSIGVPPRLPAAGTFFQRRSSTGDLRAVGARGGSFTSSIVAHCTSLRWDVPPPLEPGFGVSGLAGLRAPHDPGVTITSIHRAVFKDMAEAHLRAMVKQLLVSEGVADTDTWHPIVVRLALEAAEALSPLMVSATGNPDPRHYIKVKKLSGVGAPEGSSLVRGVVCKKNVAHRRMRTHIEQPRIILLSGALEYQRVAARLSSFDTLLDQEQEGLKRAVKRVLGLRPDVVLVERSVARAAQEELLDAHISLVLNVKADLLDRLSRVMGVKVMPTLEQLAEASIGTCQLFRVETLQPASAPSSAPPSGPPSRSASLSGSADLLSPTAAAAVALPPPFSSSSSAPIPAVAPPTRRPTPPPAGAGGPAAAAGGAASSYTLMSFVGCPQPLGATILLQGASEAQLVLIKKVVLFASYAAYHHRLENAFLADEMATAYAATATAQGLDTMDAHVCRSMATAHIRASADAASGLSELGIHLSISPHVSVWRSFDLDRDPAAAHPHATGIYSRASRTPTPTPPSVPSSRPPTPDPTPAPPTLAAPPPALQVDVPRPATPPQAPPMDPLPSPTATSEDTDDPLQMPASPAFSDPLRRISATPTVDEDDLLDLGPLSSPTGSAAAQDISLGPPADPGQAPPPAAAAAANGAEPPTPRAQGPSAAASGDTTAALSSSTSGASAPPEPAHPLPAALQVYSHQRIWFSMAWRNQRKQLLCEPAQVKCMAFYAVKDASLASLLLSWAPAATKVCHQEACRMGYDHHIRTFMHANTRLTLSWEVLPHADTLPGEEKRQIWMWMRRKNEPPGPQPSVRRVPLSPEAGCLSFGAFLDLSFSAHNLEVFGVPLHSGFTRYFGIGRTVMCVYSSPIWPQAVLMPDTIIEYSLVAQLMWLKQEAADLNSEGCESLDVVELALKQHPHFRDASPAATPAPSAAPPAAPSSPRSSSAAPPAPAPAPTPGRQSLKDMISAVRKDRSCFMDLVELCVRRSTPASDAAGNPLDVAWEQQVVAGVMELNRLRRVLSYTILFWATVLQDPTVLDRRRSAAASPLATAAEAAKAAAAAGVGAGTGSAAQEPAAGGASTPPSSGGVDSVPATPEQPSMFSDVSSMAAAQRLGLTAAARPLDPADAAAAPGAAQDPAGRPDAAPPAPGAIEAAMRPISTEAVAKLVAKVGHDMGQLLDGSKAMLQSAARPDDPAQAPSPDAEEEPPALPAAGAPSPPPPLPPPSLDRPGSALSSTGHPPSSPVSDADAFADALEDLPFSDGSLDADDPPPPRGAEGAADAVARAAGEDEDDNEADDHTVGRWLASHEIQGSLAPEDELASDMHTFPIALGDMGSAAGSTGMTAGSDVVPRSFYTASPDTIAPVSTNADSICSQPDDDPRSLPATPTSLDQGSTPFVDGPVWPLPRPPSVQPPVSPLAGLGHVASTTLSELSSLTQRSGPASLELLNAGLRLGGATESGEGALQLVPERAPAAPTSPRTRDGTDAGASAKPPPQVAPKQQQQQPPQQQQQQLQQRGGGTVTRGRLESAPPAGAHQPFSIAKMMPMLPGRAMLPTGINDAVVPLFDGEPTSVISYFLSSRAYQQQLNAAMKLAFHAARPLATPLPEGGEVLEDEDWLTLLLSREQLHVKHNFEDESLGMPWARAKYQVVAHFAPQFAELRRRAIMGGEAAFLASLCRCRKWESRGGKSSAYFAKTRDDRYIVKSLSKQERASFMELAPAYFAHLAGPLRGKRPTALAKILGVFTVTMKTVQGGMSGAAGWQKDGSIDVVVQENAFYGRHIARIYDLKGSERARFNQEAAANPSDTGAVHLDDNLRQANAMAPILVEPRSLRSLERALWADTAFLARHGVMDYSLLVGLDHEGSAGRQLVVALIDYIRQYTWDKQLETWVKSSGILGGNGKEPTIISPKQYMRRFRTAMMTYFTMVPSAAEVPDPLDPACDDL